AEIATVNSGNAYVGAPAPLPLNKILLQNPQTVVAGSQIPAICRDVGKFVCQLLLNGDRFAVMLLHLHLFPQTEQQIPKDVVATRQFPPVVRGGGKLVCQLLLNRQRFSEMLFGLRTL